MAKAFVEKHIEAERISDYSIENAKKVIADKRNHTLGQVEDAEQILEKLKVKEFFPF